VVLVLLAAIWTPQIEKFGSLFEYLQIVLGLICPPVVAVFILGLFWKRANANGAFAALMTGFVLAIFLIWSRVTENFEIGQMHFLHQAILLLVICVVVHVVVSLASAPPALQKISSLTWSREVLDAETAELAGLPWYKNYRTLSAILLILTAIIVIYFW
jgi:SSS family solute:Na+ symporter